MMLLVILLTLAALPLSAHPAAAAQVAESFDDGFDTDEFTAAPPDGFEIDVISGKLVITKSEGTTAGYAYLTSTFSLEGDFDIVVLADRTSATSGSAMGLITWALSSPTGFTDVFFSGTGGLNSNIRVGAINKTTLGAAPDSFAAMRIRRIGDQIIHETDTGGGYVQISDATDPVLAGPVQVSVFLAEEAGAEGAAKVTFDDLVINAAVITPPCGNGVVESGEACDDDDSSWVTGQACNASCELLFCGDADDSGEVSATDALHALRTSVGVRACDACVCDTDSSGGELPTSVSDALRVLRVSVGHPLELNCPPCE